MKSLSRYLMTLIVFCGSIASAQAQKHDDSTDSKNHKPVSVSAELRRNGDQSLLLIVTAQIAQGFHIYSQSQPRPFLAARIKLDEHPGVMTGGAFQPSRQPSIRKHQSLAVELHEFEHEISWTMKLNVDHSINQSDLMMKGSLFAQACTSDRCLAPESFPFEAELSRTSASTQQPALSASNKNTDKMEVATEKSASFTAGNPAVFQLTDVEVHDQSAHQRSINVVIPLAFLAGLLLNFMPCVLPVVGLKVLSFVEQAGHDRRRMLLLNVAYSAGLVTVMMTLASLAVFAGLGWGEQFSSAAFGITLAAVVFAFALSFLSVWEIPVPGLVNSPTGGSTEQQEGYTGAFTKGILSTVLATPCSGPFLGSALTWSITQPVYLTYLIFLTVGLGMASPYLLIGAFPKLVSFLPKPGNWMVTFKQLMGFVLLATVVYLMSFLPVPTLVPMAVLLLGVGISCWLLGGTLLIGNRRQKMNVTVQAIAVTSVAVFIAFGWLEGVMAERFELAAQRLVGKQLAIESGSDSTSDRIDWQPFSNERLEQHIRNGQTVFVDFTADWCLTCKSNEAVAIETEEVRTLLANDGVVALRADKTQPAPEVDAALRTLGNKAASIPFYAIFPADNPTQPILLDGVFATPQPVVDALSAATLSGQDAAMGS